MPRYIYGEGYGDIGNRELATDAARDSRFFNTLNANQRAQQIADAEDQAAASQQMQWSSLLANIAAQHRQEARAGQAHDFDLFKLQNANRQFQQQLQLEAQRIAASQGDRKAQEFMALIGQGAITPGQADELYPGLPEGTRDVGKAVYGNFAAENSAEATANDNAAQNANQLLRMERLKKANNEAMAKFPTSKSFLGFGGRTAEEQKALMAPIVADVEAGRQPLPFLDPLEFKTFVDALFKNRGLQNRVAVDEERQAFMPAPTQRRFMMPQSAPPVNPQPTAAPTPSPAATTIPVGYLRAQGGTIWRWNGVTWEPKL